MTDTPENERDPRERIRRLLVAIDASASCLDALDELAALAAGLEFEMRTVFIEDTDLLDLVGHRVLTAYSAQSHASLDSQTIERTMRHRAAAAERAVAAAAARGRVPVHFEVRRGRTALEVVRSAGEDELIVISRQARGFTVTRDSARQRVGPAAREILGTTKRPVLVLGSVGSLTGPLYAVFDGTRASLRALEFTAAIAGSPKSRTVVVLLLAADGEDAARLKRAAQAQLAPHGVTAVYQTVRTDGLEALVAALSLREEGVLVLDGGQALLQDSGAQELMERLQCSILLVR